MTMSSENPNLSQIFVTLLAKGSPGYGETWMAFTKRLVPPES